MIKCYNGLSIAFIDSVTDLSIEQAIELKKNNITQIRIFAKAHREPYDTYAGYWQQAPYDIDTYIATRMKLNELVEDIDMSISDEEKFAIIYSRICRNITYDYPAAYPIGPKEKQYEKDNMFKCRDLRNGLLEGKCVCAGYADILRSALELVGIEARYISGPIIGERKVQNKIIDMYNSLKDESILKKVFEKPVDMLKHPDIEYHAWVRVKINGNWYNSDPTWDADNIRNGLEPVHALESDKQLKKSNKLCNMGPKCVTEVSKKEINQLFGHNNLYVAGIKIPNMQDVKGRFKLIAYKYSLLGNQTLKSFNVMKEKIMLSFKRRKALPSGEKIDSVENVNNAIQQENLSNNQTNEGVKSWDLRNWGIDANKLEKQPPENNNEISQKTSDIKLDER